MAGLFLPTTRTSQPSQWLPGAAQNSLTRGLSELLIPHHFKTAIRGIAPTTIGTGLRLRQYPLGTFFGPAAFANSSAVGSLIVPGMGWRLTPPFTIGLVGVLQSTSSPVGLAECYTNNNSGWRITAATQQLQGVVTRSGATVTISDPATTDIHEPFVLMFAVTATTTELFVNGVSVATGSHSSYSAGANSLYVGMANGSTTNPGGVALLAGWNRIPSAVEVHEFAQNPWRICPPNTRQIWVDVPASGVTIDCTPGNATAAGIQATIQSPINIGCAPGNAVAAGIQATISSNVTIACTPGNAVAAGVSCAIEEGSGNVEINCTPGNAIAEGITCAIEAVSPGGSVSSSGGGGGAFRSQRSSEFNRFIKGLFEEPRKKPIKQKLAQIAEDAKSEEKLQVAIASLQAAFDSRQARENSELALEVETTLRKLQARLKELEEEEGFVVSNLLL